MMRKDQDSTAKRRHPRKSFRRTISLMGAGKSHLVEGIEIGEGGLSFNSKTRLELNKKLILNFFLSDKDFFSVRVTLLNVLNSASTFTYGASFDDVTIALKRQIRVYVART